MGAPVCKVSPPNQVSQPPQVQLPAFPQPQANNMDSIINALNALMQAVQMLAGQIHPSGGRSNAPGGGFSVRNSGSPATQSKQNQQQQGQWVFLSQKTSQHKIVNPDDSSQFVTVTRIDSITYQNSASGQVITVAPQFTG